MSDIPDGTRELLVRIAGTRHNTAMIIALRIDADYSEPAGGFHPVKITYAWDEQGQEKTHVHVATKPEETYVLNIASDPLLKSLTVELAQ